MTDLKTIFKIKSILKSYAVSKGLDHEFTRDLVNISGYSEAYSSNPKIDSFDGKTPIQYPETIQITFNNWCTSHYDLRTADSGWVREGRNLNTTKPDSAAKVLRLQLKEIRAFVAHRNARKALNFRKAV